MSTIETYIQEYLSGKAITTQATYRQALTQFERWLSSAGTNLTGFIKVDVQQYLDYLTAKKKSAATIHKTHQAIKSFCRYTGNTKAIENIRMIKQPSALQQAPRALEKSEVRRVLREANNRYALRDHTIIVLLLNTGLRVGELVALDRDDVELGSRKGRLTVTWGKGGKTAKLPLNNEARHALGQYLTERKDSNPALFISNRERRIDRRTVQNRMATLGINAHALRHTFITNLVRSGADISIVQALSRHASADMILRYSKPTEDDLENALEKVVFWN